MKPILFNTEMVRAILDGRKTCTRRVIKRLPLCEPHATVYDGRLWIEDKYGEFHPAEAFCNIQPSDILYVRETWNGLRLGNKKTGYRTTYWYKADAEDDNPDDKWRPSIHMPREAARIFLRVTEVRLERLQKMTEEDVIAEGAEDLILSHSCEHMDFGVTPPEPCYNTGACKKCWWIDRGYPEMFGQYVWDHTVPKDQLHVCGWNANPWVWVIEFERIEKP